MLAELDSSQAEVQKMLADQREQADELGGLRDNLANEVSLCPAMRHAPEPWPMPQP